MTSALTRPLEDVLHARYEKSARALVAVVRALERNHPLGGAEDEFIALARAAEEVDPELFTRVWRDPFAYWWVRHAYQLVASTLQDAELPIFTRTYADLLGAENAAEALTQHLDQFKVISLGLAQLTGQDVAFATPLISRTPLAIPGTRTLVPGPGEVEIGGCKDGRLVGAHGESLRTAECPVAQDGDLEWRLQSAAFNLPGLGYNVPDDAYDLAWQESCVPYAEEALRLVAKYQPSMREPFTSVSRLIGFKKLNSGDFTNVTHSELPGSFVCSLTRDPYDLADTMIHEFHHNLLYALEEDAPFFAGDADRGERFYSPWRPDERDLHGILHAIYVFIATGRFWLAVQQSGDVTGPIADYMADRLVRYPLQLQLGIEVMERQGRFTEHGAALFETLKRDVDELVTAIAASGTPADAPAYFCDEDRFVPEVLEGRHYTARETIIEHLRRHDSSGTGRVAADAISLSID